MKTTCLSLVGVVALTSLFGQLTAVRAASLEDPVNWRVNIAQQREADQAMVDILYNSGALQKKLDILNRQKMRLQREFDYTRIKLEQTIKELEVVTKMENPDKDLIDKRQKYVNVWMERNKLVESDMAKTDEELKQTVDAYRKSLSDTTMQTKMILPGEVLQVFVLEDEAFNGLYQVRSGGYVVMPRVGRVSVVGKDINAAETAIKESLSSAGQLKNATVSIERSPGIYTQETTDVIYLTGEFKTTGPLKIPSGTQPTLVTTILRSGGLSPSADLTKVKLLRLEAGKSLVEEVNVQAILDGAGMQSDLALNAGDVVVVPSFAPVIYVTGNVTKPGVIQLSTDEELTAYSAILRCGGFARFAKLKGVYVLRDRGNGDKSRIPVNIKSVQAGKEQDVVLTGKDIVVVPEKFFSW